MQQGNSGGWRGGRKGDGKGRGLNLLERSCQSKASLLVFGTRRGVLCLRSTCPPLRFPHHSAFSLRDSCTYIITFLPPPIIQALHT